MKAKEASQNSSSPGFVYVAGWRMPLILTSLSEVPFCLVPHVYASTCVLLSMAKLHLACMRLVSGVSAISCFVQMTGTTDIEEELMGAGGMVPFSIEAKLRKYGAYFRQGTSDTRPFATRSGSIVTGQNCASTLLTAEGLVEAMSLGVRMTIA